MKKTHVFVLIAAAAVAVLALRHPPTPAAIAAQPPARAQARAAPTADGAASRTTHRRRRRGRGREPAAAGQAVLYVAGAVRRPGLYRVGPQARAVDAIALAGGMSADADAGGVNLAAHVGDGDEVFVPRAGERTSRRSTALRRASHRSKRAAAPPSDDVDVNAADAETLAAVPGIGKAVAGRIVEMREREGSFSSLDELLDVAGMTATRLARAQPYLRPP